MRRNLLLYIFFLLLIQCSYNEQKACNEIFLETIINDFDGNSNFLVIDAFVDGQYRKICAPNIELFAELKRKYNIKEGGYKDLVLKLVNHEDTAKFAYSDVSNYIVTTDAEIKGVYEKGLDSLKARYFNSSSVQKEMPIENINYLVSLLFENCIISWVDDYTGYIVIKEDY